MQDHAAVFAVPCMMAMDEKAGMMNGVNRGLPRPPLSEPNDAGAFCVAAPTKYEAEQIAIVPDVSLGLSPDANTLGGIRIN